MILHDIRPVILEKFAERCLWDTPDPPDFVVPIFPHSTASAPLQPNSASQGPLLMEYKRSQDSISAIGLSCGFRTSLFLGFWSKGEQWTLPRDADSTQLLFPLRKMERPRQLYIRRGNNFLGSEHLIASLRNAPDLATVLTNNS